VLVDHEPEINGNGEIVDVIGTSRSRSRALMT